MLKLLQSAETVYSNNGVMKENQIAHHIFMNLLNMLIAISLMPCVSPSGSEKSTHITRHTLNHNPDPSWANCIPPSGDSTPQFWHSGSGGYPCLGSRFPLRPKYARWRSCLDSELASPWLASHTLWCQKSSRVTCCVGRGIVLDIHNVWLKNARHPKETYNPGEAWCSIGGWGFHPAVPVHSSHHGERHPIAWLMGHG